MKVVNARIKSKFNFTTMKSILLPIIIIVFLMKMGSHKNIKLTQAHTKLDTIYVGLPSHFDTVDVKARNPDITCIVLDKNDLKGYVAPGIVSFDIPRSPSFKDLCLTISFYVRQRQIGYSQLSDSLTHSRQTFFKRHIFYVIISRQDTCFFYKATGNYMDKNFENEVHYD